MSGITGCQRPFSGITKKLTWPTLLNLFDCGVRPARPGLITIQNFSEIKSVNVVECGDEIFKVLQSCWHPDPDDRPNALYLFCFFERYRLAMSSAEGISLCS